ncbi:MAG: WecB/TagA/CpsF family glycosyltransferase [Alphaproteobacteria bacterium]|jgi:N-acetylglucosaminyldiphosphoundecaprenol N-acetyl-beta-D-mannosaminyltransferase|nr:WecB/TagA/CpsF family glycosyltransferase [Alphaproteobacteria bacterium]MBU1548500.1 WecB/TagA/CpsF family glycosyltransferase [Alphaproteobacteria bacterium]MBU2337696.1 WecB/TagA/CpsF family glycosyltransferase [Alphaproteobacteria bacterium]MBU2389833.1 WecB/TagA/CpsF family glycosyltransferase [Alphaproteobacteria bacterium]
MLIAPKLEPSVERLELFSFPVDTFDRRTLLDFINSRLSLQKKTIIAHLNLHGLKCLLTYPRMAAFANRPETYVHIDGMPIVWLLKIKGAAVSRDNRLTYLDWAEELLSLAQVHKWSVAYIGSSTEVCSRAVRFFSDKYPGLNIRGWDGYFDMGDTNPGSKLSTTIDEVNGFQPDLLMVGMGMPRQEIFVHEYFDQLDFKVGFCCGAFFEYFVGGQALPPRWTGRFGVEWLYRLARNPARYAHRYLVEPFQLIGLLLRKRFSFRDRG